MYCNVNVLYYNVLCISFWFDLPRYFHYYFSNIIPAEKLHKYVTDSFT